MTTIEIIIGSIILTLLTLCFTLLAYGMFIDNKASKETDWDRYKQLSLIGYATYTWAGYAFASFILLSLLILIIRNL